MTDRRPILLGMNNPQSDDPRHALFPHPPGCAGWNLWQFTGLERREYMELFERRNVLQSRLWDTADARRAAEALPAELHDRTVVMLGADVVRLVGQAFILARPYQWHRHQVTTAGRDLFDAPGGWWARIPHPSGRCREWNDDMHRAAVRLFFEELAEAARRGET